MTHPTRPVPLDDIESLAVGAWILGTGGGGSPYLGLLNMRRIYAEGGQVRLMDPFDLADEDAVAVVSNMGAPLVGQERLADSRTVARAVEIMESHIEETLSQELLAQQIGLSRRQLERLFRRHLGRTPAQYYLETRLERAKHLLYQTDMPIMSVACATGFVSASHFTTCYRQMFGKTPRAERVRVA